MDSVEASTNDFDLPTTAVCRDVKFTKSKPSAVRPVMKSLSGQRNNGTEIRKLIRDYDYGDYIVSLLPYLVTPLASLLAFLISMYKLRITLDLLCAVVALAVLPVVVISVLRRLRFWLFLLEYPHWLL